jgi:sugar lactone lactonase YvrE
MLPLRILSLFTLLVGILLRPGDARAGDQTRTWQVFVPAQKPPVFYEPTAVAVGADGRVYVTDAVTSSVQVFSASGEPQAQLSGLGRLKHPKGVAVDARGVVYVADTDHIVALLPTGDILWDTRVPGIARVAVNLRGSIYALQNRSDGKSLVRVISSRGHVSTLVQASIRNPPAYSQAELLDIAFDSHGRIVLLLDEYVAPRVEGSTGSNYYYAQILSARGKLVKQRLLGAVGEQDSTEPGIRRTIVDALAVDKRDNLVLSVNIWNEVVGSGIVLLSPGDRLISWFRVPECTAEWTTSAGLAVDNQGTIYRSGKADRSVRTFSPQLVPLAVLGGCPPQEVTQPQGVAVDTAGNVYVSDTNHIKEFAPDGQELSSWPATKPYALSVDPGGEVFVVYGDRAVVDVFSSAGKLLRHWGNAASKDGFRGIAVDGKGHVYVSDSGGAVRVFAPNGGPLAVWRSVTGGGKTVKLSSPAGLALDTQGNLYVADSVDDSGKQRVLALSPSGGLRDISKYTSDPYWSMEVAVDGQGNVYTDLRGGFDILEVSPTHRVLTTWRREGEAPGAFSGTAGMAVDMSRGILYVADSGNQRVQKISTGGGT